MKKGIYALMAILFFCYQAKAQDLTINTVEVDRYHFSSYDKDAQIWSAIYIASNNKIYIGLCTHGDAATVYEFDIATNEMKQLANLTKLLG